MARGSWLISSARTSPSFIAYISWINFYFKFRNFVLMSILHHMHSQCWLLMMGLLMQRVLILCVIDSVNDIMNNAIITLIPFNSRFAIRQEGRIKKIRNLICMINAYRIETQYSNVDATRKWIDFSFHLIVSFLPFADMKKFMQCNNRWNRLFCLIRCVRVHFIPNCTCTTCYFHHFDSIRRNSEHYIAYKL